MGSNQELDTMTELPSLSQGQQQFLVTSRALLSRKPLGDDEGNWRLVWARLRRKRCDVFSCGSPSVAKGSLRDQSRNELRALGTST